MKDGSINRFPVIVFGTTPDYVERLYSRYPNDYLYVLDNGYRESSYLKDINLRSVVFSDMGDLKKTLLSMKRHFSKNRIVPRGMGCFDCESLLAASEAASCFGLKFPSATSIRNARNKFISKNIWSESGIPTPIAVVASSLQETIDFYNKYGKAIVLKPLSSSGSELVFYCCNEKEIGEAVETLFSQLGNRKAGRRIKMEKYFDSGEGYNIFKSWVAEEFISGPEFSCDFVLRDDHVTILRTSGKIKDEEQPLGTILVYTIPALIPPELSQRKLSERFRHAAKVLGFNWGWFMVDFVVRNDEPVILEISPRPGGDSIPDLIEFASGQDILRIYLDLAGGNSDVPEEISLGGKLFASVNLFASENGLIRELDISGIKELDYVHKVFTSAKVNDRIVLPPFDYDSWKVGYCIISVHDSMDLIGIYKTLQKRLSLSVMDFPDTLPELGSSMRNSD